MEFTGTCPKTLPNDVQLKEPSKRLVWELISPLDILDSTRQKGGMQMHSLLGAQEKKPQRDTGEGPHGGWTLSRF